MAVQPICLRVEPPNGKAAEEYRIRDDEVEVRQLQPANREAGEWHRVSPDELSDHVYRGTVVAKWLKHRLGQTRLLRACVAKQSWFDTGETASDSRAA